MQSPIPRCSGGTVASSGIQVIDRAVSLLRLLASADEPMRLGEVATGSGLSPSTTRRILASLVENGLCEQGADGTYRLGLGTFELGQRAGEGIDLRDRGRPVLQELANTSHLTSFLCIRREWGATCIERVDGRYAFSLALTIGGTLPLHVGAAPRALLAYESDEAIRDYLRAAQPLERFTDKTLTDPEAVLADLRESRERGWIVSDEDVTPGVAALAVPVFGHDSPRPIAAVSIAGLHPQVLGDRTDELVATLRDAAERLSRELGHRPGARTSPPRYTPQEAA
jgi:DNA-binding IclR family transcriptional regulator